MRKKNIVFVFTIFILISLISLSGCIFQTPGRLSGPVLFIHSPPIVQDWLQQPAKSYVQAYFMFPEDFASDIIFGIDQEFIEGVNNPIHFKGADWMALVGLTRDGILNIPIGTPESLNGTPSDASVWEFIDLDVELLPNTWYFIKEIADFNTLKFESFTLIGPNVNKTIDLSKYYVDYPNYIPIDNRSLTYYVYAVRLYEGGQNGSTKIYFDDVEAGIETINGFETILIEGFENQDFIPDIPIKLPVSPLSDINEYYWYKENQHAIIEITDEIFRSGNKSCLCDVTLKGINHYKNITPLFSKTIFKSGFPSILKSVYLLLQKISKN